MTCLEVLNFIFRLKESLPSRTGTEPDLHFKKITPCCISVGEKVGSKGNSKRPARGPLKSLGSGPDWGWQTGLLGMLEGTFKVSGDGFKMAVRQKDDTCLWVYAFSKLT